LPEKFTFPFYYTPHPLSVAAAADLQRRIESMGWNHNFGLSESDEHVIGKMFGVLVVKNSQGELGYLSAFSGKVADSNHHEGFVPPVYDMLAEDGFFNQGMAELMAINRRVAELSAQKEYIEAKDKLEQGKAQSAKEIEDFREVMRQKKHERKLKREEANDLDSDATENLKKELSKESLAYKYQLKVLTKDWEEELQKRQKHYDQFNDVIQSLKNERKTKSAALQARIFSEYHFLDAHGSTASLGEIFENTPVKVPPGGAGECAAPKLLQYAYLHDLTPICMAEFWWGESPKSEIRRHKRFYPSCRGKCEPILGHMLQGLSVDDNPLLATPTTPGDLEIIYEDDDVVAVNKPAEFLSVPGKTSLDSVYDRMVKKYPNATGPLIIHRLDMATSGILLLAKTKEANKYIQYQFIHRTVKKRYVALLEGEISEDEGLVDLPIRLDLNDRPRQLVCDEHGKPAQTKWKVLDRSMNRTRIQFFPITGRTHQLRVHAAHPRGLNTPILGDDLYGNPGPRLHLHAEYLEFVHPRTKEKMTLQVDPAF